ncbi:N-acetyltransferase 6-like isoform X2 [Limulus polyphemus]|uniref:N-acetyltransferase 6-like isoform X2 n=1 Tax=Limulus polyphemus TaxID=6850 RepID=A0ABM1BNF9_LIMPO|nr:N-acetyltransferase 6-like isoform X2 [Limulus polyphemus]
MIHSLEKSNHSLPVSLVLVENLDHEDPEVIGHSRICRVLDDNSGCWIESVVIKKNRRNQGFGKLLMLKTEEFARRLGFKTAYLNTIDKQDFYKHLGYIFCDPVSSDGGNVSRYFVEKMREKIGSPLDGSNCIKKWQTLKHSIDDESFTNREQTLSKEVSTYPSSVPTLSSPVSVLVSAVVPPPPPPPVIGVKKDFHSSAKTSENITAQHLNSKRTWMKKSL